MPWPWPLIIVSVTLFAYLAWLVYLFHTAPSEDELWPPVRGDERFVPCEFCGEHICHSGVCANERCPRRGKIT